MFGRAYRLGWLTVGSPGAVRIPAEKWTGPWGAFRAGLQNAGFVPGKNLIVEHRHADGDQARLAAEVESLVATKVDLIVTQGTPPTVAAMKASRPVPVVFFRRRRSRREGERMTDAATAAGLESLSMPVNTLDEVGSKLAEFSSGGNAGVVVIVDRVLWNWRASIMETALKIAWPRPVPRIETGPT